MVVLCFKLSSNSLHSSHALPICPDISFNGLMFTCGSFHCSQISSKVVLATTKFSSSSNSGNSQGKNVHVKVQLRIFVTWETNRWFSLSHVSLIAALRSNRAASISSFSWRINSFLRASSRSCSAFSSLSQAWEDNTKNIDNMLQIRYDNCVDGWKIAFGSMQEVQPQSLRKKMNGLILPCWCQRWVCPLLACRLSDCLLSFCSG